MRPGRLGGAAPVLDAGRAECATVLGGPQISQVQAEHASARSIASSIMASASRDKAPIQ